MTIFGWVWISNHRKIRMFYWWVIVSKIMVKVVSVYTHVQDKMLVEYFPNYLNFNSSGTLPTKGLSSVESACYFIVTLEFYTSHESFQFLSIIFDYFYFFWKLNFNFSKSVVCCWYLDCCLIFFWNIFYLPSIWHFVTWQNLSSFYWMGPRISKIPKGN